ncbi:uncharacterized protein LOC130698051 [Daphnia carinata]|uniref:uncharacterized protein LOC130698051 n=1 Tax=Daphnia carinata TaxID=120202 RepID=UPI00257A41BD|nr:uncharacterized protein LOC130698051 [Daphnia carinata]XP_057376826.1 uncharacterized protein LOC130698051 [Daphnia carinata]
MSSIISDDEADVTDLITCSVCFSEFDNANHKPKFLPCAHSICRACLVAIQNDGKIRCPLCRTSHTHWDDVASLPNNVYALRLAIDKNQNKASHEALLKLKAELEDMKDRRHTNWSETIGKRKEIQSYLLQVLDAIKNAKKEIQEKLEENGRIIAELTRQCEGRSERNSSVYPTEKEPPVDKTLLGLSSLMSGLQLTICPGDSKETIKEKMKISVEDSEQNLTLVSAEVDSLRTWKKARFTIRADSDAVATFPLIWHTIMEMDWTRTPTSSNDFNFLLVSYMIFSLSKSYVVQDVPTFGAAIEAPVSTRRTISHLIPRLLRGRYSQSLILEAEESSSNSSNKSFASRFKGLFSFSSNESLTSFSESLTSSSNESLTSSDESLTSSFYESLSSSSNESLTSSNESLTLSSSESMDFNFRVSRGCLMIPSLDAYHQAHDGSNLVLMEN